MHGTYVARVAHSVRYDTTAGLRLLAAMKPVLCRDPGLDCPSIVTVVVYEVVSSIIVLIVGLILYYY